MSADTEGLARFDTRRAVQTDKHSEQTDLRAIGVREHGQLVLDEVETVIGAAERTERAGSGIPVATSEPTRGDLEAALECARTTVDGLREQVEKLEAERDRLRQEVRGRAER